MEEFETITLKEFFDNYKSDENPTVLIDLDSCSIRVRNDYYIRNENVINHRKLCDYCDGTGNEFMAAYHECPECEGRGWVNETHKK